jgi:hypothetical protein
LHFFQNNFVNELYKNFYFKNIIISFITLLVKNKVISLNQTH